MSIISMPWPYVPNVGPTYSADDWAKNCPHATQYDVTKNINTRHELVIAIVNQCEVGTLERPSEGTNARAHSKRQCFVPPRIDSTGFCCHLVLADGEPRPPHPRTSETIRNNHTQTEQQSAEIPIGDSINAGESIAKLFGGHPENATEP